MTNGPIVSVIVPVYNVSDYIERCVRSIINQTYHDIECLIVDDCTQDDSIGKCCELLKDYSGPIAFTILQHEKNKGLSAARNTGTLNATGKYVYYLDSDDEITPDCLSKLVETAEGNDGVEMVQGNYAKCKGNEQKVWYKGRDTFHVESNEKVRHYCFIERVINGCAWNKLIRRTFIMEHQLFFKDGVIIEDMLWMFYMRIFLTNVCALPDVTYYYHVRPNSIMTGTEKRELDDKKYVIYEEILNHLPHGKESIELRDYRGDFCYRYMTTEVKSPIVKETFNLYVNKAIKYDCWDVAVKLWLIKIFVKIGGKAGNFETIEVIWQKLISLVSFHSKR